MPEDHPVDFVCALQGGAGESRGRPCRSTDPLLVVQATASSHRRGLCLEILPCGAAIARCSKRVQFSSGLNYLIDIENTVIATSRLRPGTRTTKLLRPSHDRAD